MCMGVWVNIDESIKLSVVIITNILTFDKSIIRISLHIIILTFVEIDC